MNIHKYKPVFKAPYVYLQINNLTIIVDDWFIPQLENMDGGLTIKIFKPCLGGRKYQYCTWQKNRRIGKKQYNTTRHLHQIVMGDMADDEEVHFLNGNSLDCRNCNLLIIKRDKEGKHLLHTLGCFNWKSGKDHYTSMRSKDSNK